MARLLKALIFIVILGFVGLVGFAYFGDLSPDRKPVSVAVEVDVD